MTAVVRYGVPDHKTTNTTHKGRISHFLCAAEHNSQICPQYGAKGTEHTEALRTRLPLLHWPALHRRLANTPNTPRLTMTPFNAGPNNNANGNGNHTMVHHMVT